MAATLKDVAEHAGVSIATVSRVLNEPEKVAEQSRIKVLNANWVIPPICWQKACERTG